MDSNFLLLQGAVIRRNGSNGKKTLHPGANTKRMPPPSPPTIPRKWSEIFQATGIGHRCQLFQKEPVKSFFASLPATPLSKQSWSHQTLLSSPGLGQGKKEASHHPETIGMPIAFLTGKKLIIFPSDIMRCMDTWGPFSPPGKSCSPSRPGDIFGAENECPPQFTPGCLSMEGMAPYNYGADLPPERW